MSTEERIPVTSGPEPLEPGRIIAEKYRIVRRLGQGGMGTVYEACHTSIERRVAIKLLRPDLAGRAEMVARFRREALAAGRIQHDNVVTITDVGALPVGLPYLVMEFLAGETLTRVLEREGALTAARATSLMVQACRGVAAAHELGVVHRDLKPDNLFLCHRADGAEQLKVLDFGIAKLETGSLEDSLVTKTGATLGTPHYMSPEQARGERSIDARTDIYSLGAVLYELLAGIRPHPGTNYNEVIYHILAKPALPLRELQPDLPTGLAAIVERTMAAVPSERYGAARDLMNALLPYTALGSTSASAAAGARATADPVAATVRLPDGPARPIESLAATSHSSQPASLRPASSRTKRVMPWVVAATAMLGGAGLVLVRVARFADTAPAARPVVPPSHSTNAPPASDVRAAAPGVRAARSPTTEPDAAPGGKPLASAVPASQPHTVAAQPPGSTGEARAARTTPAAGAGPRRPTTPRAQSMPSQPQRKQRAPSTTVGAYDPNNPYR